jgi:hypothetical protein
VALMSAALRALARVISSSSAAMRARCLAINTRSSLMAALGGGGAGASVGS